MGLEAESVYKVNAVMSDFAFNVVQTAAFRATAILGSSRMICLANSSWSMIAGSEEIFIAFSDRSVRVKSATV